MFCCYNQTFCQGVPAVPARRLSPKIVVSVVFVAAMFLNILDTTIINVALPTISAQFGVAPTETGTIVVGYLLSLAMVIPASGWLGDRLGTKRVFLFALAVFTLASALSGLAQNLPQLVAFRILQGVGGGMLAPVGMAMLFRVFALHERMRAMRVLILPTAVAPALGPVLGGLLVDTLSWRWVFYVNVPIGIAAFVFGLLLLTEYREPTAGRFDLAGFLLSGSGFALLMYALTEGASQGWTSPVILATGLSGLVLLAVMVVVELRVPEPMLDLRLFADRMFRTINVMTLISTAAFLGVLFVFPLMYQDGIGASALDTGLNTFPEAVGVVLGTQVASRIYTRFGPRRHIAIALVNTAASMALLATIGPDSPRWVAMLIMFYLGVSISNQFNPGQTAAFATLPAHKTGGASTLFNSGRQAGAAIGVAVLGSVLAAVGTPAHAAGGTPDLTAYHVAFLVAAALSLAAAGYALLIRDKDAASTMTAAAQTAAEPVAA
ncbi:MDR family MFS transporter [Kutzneria viridogrisea]